jgi:5-deoxy-glucuronate isomerase
MSKLRLRPQRQQQTVHAITPESAGWTYVGFHVHTLKPGQSLAEQTGDREVCLVLISGTARLSAGAHDFGEAGERLSPFAGKPWSLYVPAAENWTVTAVSDVTLAVCSAPGRAGSHPIRLIRPEDTSQEIRGKGTNTRYVTNILPDTLDAAASLLVVEVITPGGHSSSYPPHKHDRDEPPQETLLEETYYHRLQPASGFAFQRVYTDDRSLDEAILIEDGDVTLVPRGYHPCAATHGHDLYYLNVMAGPKRLWRFHNDPAHEWLLKA